MYALKGTRWYLELIVCHTSVFTLIFVKISKTTWIFTLSITLTCLSLLITIHRLHVDCHIWESLLDRVLNNKNMFIYTCTSNNQRLGSAFDAVTVIPWRNSSADFHLLSLAKINTVKKKKSDPDVLQAYIQERWFSFSTHCVTAPVSRNYQV